MLTLQELQKSIQDYITSNPDAKKYPVIGFDFLNSKKATISPVKQFHFLVTHPDGVENIFDTEEEMNECQFDETFKIKKVILL